jgi:hypothetical protein
VLWGWGISTHYLGGNFETCLERARRGGSGDLVHERRKAEAVRPCVLRVARTQCFSLRQVVCSDAATQRRRVLHGGGLLSVVRLPFLLLFGVRPRCWLDVI